MNHDVKKYHVMIHDDVVPYDVFLYIHIYSTLHINKLHNIE